MGVNASSRTHKSSKLMVFSPFFLCLWILLGRHCRHQVKTSLFPTLMYLVLYKDYKILWAHVMGRLFSCQPPLYLPWPIIFDVWHWVPECRWGPLLSKQAPASWLWSPFPEHCSGEKRAREQRSGETIAPWGDVRPWELWGGWWYEPTGVVVSHSAEC